MALKRPVRDIATSLIAAAHEAEVVLEVMRDLGSVADVFEQHRDLLASLGERTIAIEDRRKAIQVALKGTIHPFVVNALLLLQQADSLKHVAAFYAAASEEARRVASFHDVVVTTASAMTTTERSAALKAATERLGGIIHLSERINPDVLGGLVLESGDWRLDASLAGKIRRLNEHLYV